MTGWNSPLPLNKQQLEAVQHEGDHVLVLAGAGSGKTRVITARILYLIQKTGIPPWQITAFTFTNKAAREMQERTASLLSLPQRDLPSVSTFHSWGARFLRRNAGRSTSWPGTSFTIIDNAQQKKVAAAALQITGQKEPISSEKLQALLYFINSCKDELLYPHNESKNFSLFDTQGLLPEQALAAYRAYQKILEKSNSLDFDDLIALPVLHLKQDPDLLAHTSRFCKHLLVDEYQDTSPAQDRLTLLLAQQKCRIFAVGDDDQSIYAFRGASVTHIRNFPKRITPCRVISLEENYRSTQAILDLANALISSSPDRPFEKNLFTIKKGGALPVFSLYRDEYSQARETAEKISLTLRQNRQYRAAILYRSNYQSRLLEEALTSLSQSYKVIGGRRFLERREIAAVSALLSMACNPQDILSLVRFLEWPASGAGKKSLAALRTHFISQEMDLHSLRSLEKRFLPPRSWQAVKKVLAAVFSIENLAEKPLNSKLIKTLVNRTGLDTRIDKLPASEDSTSRQENLIEFYRFADDYSINHPGATFSTFLETISLQADTDSLDQQNPVQLMTIHNSKGLEFDIVHLINCREGSIPHERSSTTPDDIEEERRLLYVGITRCRNLLHLSSPVYGRGGNVYQVSRFLSEIDKTLLQYYNLSGLIDEYSDINSETSGYISPLTSENHDFF
jgi:DNA helicase-2/ATP-dependent DNA helicase PcrA